MNSAFNQTRDYGDRHGDDTLNVAFPFSYRRRKMPLAQEEEGRVGDETFESATREILKPS